MSTELIRWGCDRFTMWFDFTQTGCWLTWSEPCRWTGPIWTHWIIMAIGQCKYYFPFYSMMCAQWLFSYLKHKITTERSIIVDTLKFSIQHGMRRKDSSKTWQYISSALLYWRHCYSTLTLATLPVAARLPFLRWTCSPSMGQRLGIFRIRTAPMSCTFYFAHFPSVPILRTFSKRWNTSRWVTT